MQIKKVEIVLSLEYLSNFWRTLKIPLINCEINLILTWSKNCVITSKATTVEVGYNRINDPTNAIFKITDSKLYVPVNTLSTQNDNKILKQLRTGVKRTIKSNRYRPEMTNETKNNNLNYFNGPTFTKINRLFVLSFKNEEDRTSFSDCYVPNVEIKDSNVLID